MPGYSLPERTDNDAGFQTRDLVRFFVVDIILVLLVRILLDLNVFPSVDSYVAAILVSKTGLFLYLVWLVRERRRAWPATGVTRLGPWWALPLAVALYAAAYPLLDVVADANDFLMLRLHDALGWVYAPRPQDVVFFIFEDILRTPTRIALIAFTVLFGPFMEELAFRGVGLDAARRRHGVVWSLVWTSLLFGLYHFTLHLVIPLAALGLLFGILRVGARSFWAALLAHVIHNTFVLLTMAHNMGIFKTAAES